MRRSLENQYAEMALKLLLNQNDTGLADHSLLKAARWDIILKLAKENRITIRLYERLMELGLQPDAHFIHAVGSERKRISQTIKLMDKISKLYKNHDLEFVFFKNYQHYPDMGDDIDLFVMELSSSSLSDSMIKEKFKGKPFKRSLLHRIAGKTQYRIEGYPCELEIHHGRMGPMGDQTAFPFFLMKNRREVSIGSAQIFVPSPEDQFIIQVLQRVYGRFSLRISELVYAINAVCDKSFDWEYVIETTKSVGIFDGVCYYLGCVGTIHRNVMKKSLPLIKPEVSVPEVTDGLRFKDFHYRLPLQTIARNLYMKKIWSDIRASRWKAAGRTCLLPFFAALITGKSIVNRLN